MEETIATVMLIVAIITPGNKPNIEHRVEMPSVKVCLEEAERFLDHYLPDGVEAAALSATCAKKRVKDVHS